MGLGLLLIWDDMLSSLLRSATVLRSVRLDGKHCALGKCALVSGKEAAVHVFCH